MTEPKGPIQLDYKTPEKGERITAGMIVWRVIAGFSGMLALFVAIVLTAGAVGNLARAINHGLFEALAEFIVGGIFALTAWIFTIRWLKYAIVGDHNFRKSKLIFKGRNENIKYE